MSQRLHQFLIEAYERTAHGTPRDMLKRGAPIQVDDQDDGDIITEFCNIYIIVKKSNLMEIELSGYFPVTQEMADLAEIYSGLTEIGIPSRLILYAAPGQIDMLTDLSNKLRKTSSQGASVNNPNWHKICARTISSLHRFIRILKEYQKVKGTLLA
jgi:hypothetical protein